MLAYEAWTQSIFGLVAYLNKPKSRQQLEMDLYKLLFWIGFIILIVAHVVGPMRQHAVIGLTGTALMFVGSKLGREFLGIN